MPLDESLCFLSHAPVNTIQINGWITGMSIFFRGSAQMSYVGVRRIFCYFIKICAHLGI